MIPSSLPSHHDRLNSITSESGLEFINSLATKQDFSGLGIDGLDSILKRYGFASGDMIDLFGGSCCGKTTLLYAICVATTLPAQCVLRTTNDHDSNITGAHRDDLTLGLGGKHKGVIFLDLDLGFDVTRLRQLFHRRIQSAVADHVSTLAADNGREERDTILKRWKDRLYLPAVEKLIDSCLANIHIFSPSSASTTIATLKTLDQYLLKLATTMALATSAPTAATKIVETDSTIHGPSASETCRIRTFLPVSILMIDSLSAFYWQERPQNNYSSFMSQLDRALHHLRTRWDLVVLFTTWSLHPSPEIIYPENWRSKVKFRFTIAPKLLERIPTHMDLIALWRTRFGDWMKRCQRMEAQTGEPWQKAEGKNHLMDSEQIRQGVPGSENDLRQKFINGGGLSLKEDEGDVDATGASFFQVQMAHPQPAAGRQWELFRFSLSDVDGVQFYSTSG
ncbi:hypothetical protein BGZ73_006800 [Actinomortierella ambigua]|nr:hypothetical protein BGZ73_006800 [Actinomortierella ambigua]